MTDGTSQGLFIVVAIVIFGIFVVLAYILFEDTLSPALANMFTNATEQSDVRLSKSLITAADFEDRDGTDSGVPNDFYENNGSKITIGNGSTGDLYRGIRLPDGFLQPYKQYEFSFDYTALEGQITFMVGYLTTSDNTTVYIDGKKIDSDWHNPDTDNSVYPKDNKKHSVRVVFNTNRWDNPSEPHNGTPSNNKKIYIQPNRKLYQEYKVVMENFRLIEK